MTEAPPRLVLALALVGATALVLLAAVIDMLALPGAASQVRLGLLARIQLGTQLLDLGVLVLVPLAVLLARLVEPGGAAPHLQATRSVVLGATAVGAASTFLLLLRLVADLGLVADPGVQVPTLVGPGTIVRDLALVLVAGTGALWASRELQRVPSSSPPPAGPSPANSTSDVPPALGARPGMPASPPTGPPPAASREGRDGRP